MKKIKTCIIFAIAFLLASCASVDMDRHVSQQSSGPSLFVRRGAPEPNIIIVPIEQEPQPVVIAERPIFVPVQETAQTLTGRAAVEAALAAGVRPPSEFSHAAMVFDFHPDWVYEVFTQPLRVTDIRLEPGERVVERPFLSDTERWTVGAGVHYYNGIPVQGIYIMPAAANLSATLIINTDRRVYHIILRSFTNMHMPMVRWRYPFQQLPQQFAHPFRGEAAAGQPAHLDGVDAGAVLVDPRFLSFNYRITFGLFNRPRWLPELVYDDGRRTYISLPASVLHGEFPAVFENRSDVVNYRVVGSTIIIDRLVEELTLRLGRQEVRIRKRGGRR